jgi:hypothetical protein
MGWAPRRYRRRSPVSAARSGRRFFSCCLVEAAACILTRLVLRRLRMSVVRPAVLHAVTPVLGVVDLASALGSFKS